ncbi:MAG TPA: hypothetical protein PLL92_15760 [Alicycliphilus sp.]|nr:hypothetical protein [Alicycliphilus sp.]
MSPPSCPAASVMTTVCGVLLMWSFVSWFAVRAGAPEIGRYRM